MQKLSRDDLYSLEQYATLRGEFRESVLEHKRNRRLAISAPMPRCTSKTA